MRKVLTALALVWAASSASAETHRAARRTTCFACHGEHGQSQTEEHALARRPAGAYALIQLFMFRELRTFDPMNEWRNR
jgi:cytochrome c553